MACGSGVGGTWTTADLGYDDPVLLAQINSNLGSYCPQAVVQSQIPPITTPPQAIPLSQPYTANLSLPAGFGCAAAGLACGTLSGALRTACFAAAGCADPNPSQGTNPLTNLPTGTTGCPTGYVLQNGRCVKSGIDQYIPGPIGTLTDYGPAVIGAFGKPALTPKQVGTIMRKDGSTHPILRCPPGSVLGRDDLCYNKGAITNKERAHPRGHRPLITGGEMHAFSVARAASKKLRKLANRFAPTHHRRGPAPKKGK